MTRSLDATEFASNTSKLSSLRDGRHAPLPLEAESPILFHTVESTVGPLHLAATARGICSLRFGEGSSSRADYAVLERDFGRPVLHGTNKHLEQCEDELNRYFMGSLREFTVPLELSGTSFQEAVWTALRNIRYGETMSYGSLALRIGRPGSQRAVGHANSQNRIAIIIPCHRIIERGGDLGGYAGHRWRKNFLLNHERKHGSLVPSASQLAFPASP